MKISPEEYQAALRVVKDYRNQLRAELDQVETEVRDTEGKNSPQKHPTLFDLLSTKQCSVRLHNVIYNNLDSLGIAKLLGAATKVKVADLEGVSVQKLLSCPSAGEATVKEFKVLCATFGVSWST